MVNIVFLDAYTVNPGDLSWRPLEKLGNFTFFNRTQPDEIIDLCHKAEIVLSNKSILTRDIIQKLPQLKYIGVTATGYNIVDTEAAKERDIIVTNVPSYSTTSVAQMVFAHILNISHRISEHSSTVHAGKWSSAKDFCYWDFPQIELAGKSMGIIGLGQIGQATAKLAHAFGMKVLGHNHRPKSNLPGYIQQVTQNELLQQCDFLSLHCPLTKETEKMVNKEFISLMKPSAILINTGRGPLINEYDLADALKLGKIAACGLDVLSTEPPSEDNPLLRAQNCFITPHIAWATKESRQRLINQVADNIKQFIDGSPVNVVN